MKKITHYTMLALLIGFLSACNSDGTNNTPTGTHAQGESAGKLDSENTTTETAETEKPESYTLITDNGVGTSNNQDTENPANH